MAKKWPILVVALVVIGVVLMLLLSKPKPDTAESTPETVTPPTAPPTYGGNKQERTLLSPNKLFEVTFGKEVVEGSDNSQTVHPVLSVTHVQGDNRLFLEALDKDEFASAVVIPEDYRNVVARACWTSQNELIFAVGEDKGPAAANKGQVWRWVPNSAEPPIRVYAGSMPYLMESSPDAKLLAFIMSPYKVTVHDVASGSELATRNYDPKGGKVVRLMWVDNKTLRIEGKETSGAWWYKRITISP
jgi:hypothetical protein